MVRLGVMAKGYRISFWGDEKDLKLIETAIAQIWAYTKHHCIVCFKWEDCMVWNDSSIEWLEKQPWRRFEQTKSSTMKELWLSTSKVNFSQVYKLGLTSQNLFVDISVKMVGWPQASILSLHPKTSWKMSLKGFVKGINPQGCETQGR